MSSTTTKSYAHNGDPSHPRSWVTVLVVGARGSTVSRTIADNPAHPNSWVRTYDAEGRVISCIYGQNPFHPHSWVHAPD